MASGQAQEIKHPGCTAWKQHTQTQDTGAGIGIMGDEDNAYNSLLFQCSVFALSTSTGLTSLHILQPVIVALNLSKIVNVEKCVIDA